MFALSKLTKNLLANFFGTTAIVLICFFFFEAAMKTPVMEVSVTTGNCLRVVAGDGKIINGGCIKARNGQIATEHRYVAK